MFTSKTKRSSWVALFFLTCLIGQVSAVFNLLREYSGPTFFDRWAYYGDIDNTTWGNVTYVDQATAVADKLTYINAAGNAIIKVDDTTTILPAPLVFRNSVRLTSTDVYGLGSVIIIDALNIPYGCSVWPAFWTLGAELPWPAAGEIDVIEAINDMNSNQLSMHTNVGCMQSAVSNQSGTNGELRCGGTASGCTVGENKPNSYGPDFAAAGGGVFALQLDATGIYSWFWSRPDIPANIQQATSSSPVDPTTWGIPTAMYPNTTCPILDYFQAQSLILVTTLCGVWAGVPSIYESTCKTPAASCPDNVIGDGSNYANAYWEIKYIRAYFDGPVSPTSTSTSISTTSVSSTQAATSSSNTPTHLASTNSSMRSLPSSILSGVLSLLLILLIGL